MRASILTLPAACVAAFPVAQWSVPYRRPAKDLEQYSFGRALRESGTVARMACAQRENIVTGNHGCGRRGHLRRAECCILFKESDLTWREGGNSWLDWGLHQTGRRRAVERGRKARQESKRIVLEESKNHDLP